jgi:hypothetical protein
VVRELQPVGAARPPRRAAAVLEHDPRGRSRPGSLRLQQRLTPHRCERLHGAAVYAGMCRAEPVTLSARSRFPRVTYSSIA